MSKALAIIGNGLGNLIEQSVVPMVATGVHSAVDIWTPRSSAVFTTVLTGIPRVERIYLHDETPAGKYSVVYTSWLMGNREREVRSPQIKKVPQPTTANKLTEAEYFVTTLFGNMAIPAAYCASELPAQLPRRGTVTIALCTGSQTGDWKLKRYPRFDAVVAALAAQIPGAFFYLLGTPTDDAVVHPQVLDLRGKYSLLETIGVLGTCDLAISNDSGLAHAAAAIKVPTLVIFGPTQLAKNLPAGATAVYLDLPCRPCQYRSPRIGIHPILKKKCGVECLNQLDPVDVAQQATLLLRNKLAAAAVQPVNW